MVRVRATDRGWAFINKGTDAGGDPQVERCRVDKGSAFDWDESQGKVPRWCEAIEGDAPKAATPRRRGPGKKTKAKAPRASDTMVSAEHAPKDDGQSGMAGFETMGTS